MNITQSYLATPAGTLALTLDNGTIIKAVFIDNPPQEASCNYIFHVPALLLQGTEFQIKVWQATQKIPAGKTASYKNIATAIGHPGSWRAVANALASNKIAYFVPCHRIISSNGNLGGYKWGTERKAVLIAHEKTKINA